MEYYKKKTILNSSQQKLSQAGHALLLIIVFSTPLENHVPLHNTSQASEANQANSKPYSSHPTLDLVTSTPTATLVFSSSQTTNIWERRSPSRELESNREAWCSFPEIVTPPEEMLIIIISPVWCQEYVVDGMFWIEWGGGPDMSSSGASIISLANTQATSEREATITHQELCVYGESIWWRSLFEEEGNGWQTYCPWVSQTTVTAHHCHNHYFFSGLYLFLIISKRLPYVNDKKKKSLFLYNLIVATQWIGNQPVVVKQGTHLRGASA